MPSDDPTPLTNPTNDPAMPLPPAEELAAATAAPKRVRFIRWGGVITLVVLLLLIVLAIPFLLQPALESAVKSALRSQGLEFAPETTFGISVFGGRIHADNLKLREIGSTGDVATATRLDADLAVIDSIRRGEVIIDELALADLSGNLRRGPSGSVPVITPKNEPDYDWGKLDWWGYAQKGLKKYRDWADQKQADEKNAEEQKKTGKPSDTTAGKSEPLKSETPDAWPKSKTYQPTPIGGSGSSVPRVLVRHLLVSFAKVHLPDESPFDLTGGKVDGVNVALTPAVGEPMTLTGALTTLGAGPVNLDIARQPDQTGTWTLAAPQVPLAALSDAKISGPQFSAYGATGMVDLHVDTAWTGWDLLGEITGKVTGLNLSPTAAAGTETQRVATYVNQLKGQPLTWPVKLGGTLYAPTITDSGVDEVLKGGALDAAKGLVKDKAGAEAQKLLDKESDKHPELKKATDGLNNLFNRK